MEHCSKINQRILASSIYQINQIFEMPKESRKIFASKYLRIENKFLSIQNALSIHDEIEPFKLCIKNDDVSKVESYLFAGASPHGKTEKDKNMLKIATESGNVEIINLMYELGRKTIPTDLMVKYLFSNGRIEEAQQYARTTMTSYKDFQDLINNDNYNFAKFLFEEVPITVIIHDDRNNIRENSLSNIIEGDTTDEKFERAKQISKKYNMFYGETFRAQLENEIEKGNFYDFIYIRSVAENILKCKINDEVIEAFVAIQEKRFDTVIDSVLQKGIPNYWIFYNMTLIQACILHEDFQSAKTLIEKGIDVNGNALINAVLKNNIDIVILLLEKGVDVNVIDKYQKNSLTYASMEGQIDIVRLLLEKGADPNVFDSDGSNSLYHAISNEHTDVARLLIENGAISVVIPRWSYTNRSSLITAIMKEQFDIAKLLIERRIGVYDRDSKKQTPLSSACSKGRLDIIKLFLENGKAISSRSGLRELNEAAKNGHIEVVRFLTEKFEIDNTDLKLVLSEAASRKHLDIVKFIIDKVDDIPPDEALINACKNGHIDIVKFLIEKGANLNGKGALYNAAIYGHFDIVKLLIESGANAKEDIQNAFVTAVEKGNIDVIRFSIEMGADVNFNSKNLKGGNALVFSLLTKGRTDIFKLLIESGLDIKKYGREALINASSKGLIDIVQILIEKGVDVAKHGDRALTGAAMNKRFDIVRLLIENGVDLSKFGDHSKLLTAASENQFDIVKLAADRISNFKRHGGIALINASEKGYTDIARFLIEKRPDIELKDEKGRNALFWAAANGHFDIVKLLLDNGANVNNYDSDNRSALSAACFGGYLGIVKLLIERGAEISYVSKSGKSALAEACCNGHINVVKFLIRAGVDVNAGKRQSALVAACTNGHTGIVKMLIEKGADIKKCGRHLADVCSVRYIDIAKILSPHAPKNIVITSVIQLSRIPQIKFLDILEIIKLSTESGSFNDCELDLQEINDPDIVMLFLENGCKLKYSQSIPLNPCIKRIMPQRLRRACWDIKPVRWLDVNDAF